MSQTDSNDDIITWIIDRTPDYSILNSINNIQNMRDFTGGDRLIIRDFINPIYYPDNNEENYNYNFIYNYNIFRNNIINSNTIFNEELDFIPFNPQSNRTQHRTQSINFIVDTLLIPEELNCCICMEEQEEQQICQLNCQHTFCITCIDHHLERKFTCPLCREDITDITTQTMEARHQIHH
jgi:hypothetical protein